MVPWRIDPEHKVLYHAAAAVAGNLPHILVRAASDLMVACGMELEGSDHPLRPLVVSSIEAALGATGMERLTGPISRGDGVSIRRHLEALPPPLAAAYEALHACVQARRGEPDLD
jgi:predicted short-subunit dehydrogenase-like oxidoreductase (DUF2520 family)